MAGTRWLWLALAAVAVAAVAALLLAPAARADNDPPDTGGTVTGDWTVNDARSYSAVKITVSQGSLVVARGGSLTLDKVVLRFDGTSDGAYGIDVQMGGSLTLKGGTNVSSTSGSVHYKFKVSGSMSIDASSVSEVWGDPGSWEGGIQIYSDSVSITNSAIEYGRTGGISIFNCTPTISNSIIRFCGQDGQSSAHAYGIYGYNTAANITFCCVTQNRYLRTDFTYYDLTKSPTSGTIFWNGNYYSGTATLYYRTETYYYTNRTSVFGCGIWLEGGSKAGILNNTVSYNGWAASGYYSTYSYSATVPMLPNITEDPTHQIRPTIYQYLNNNNYGTGIFSKNCTLDIRGNLIDRNGCDPTTSSYYSRTNPYGTTWIGCHRGVGITMLGSGGNISGNTVSGSVILINLTSSNFNITDNILSTDLSYYQYVPQRNMYGILSTNSHPYIQNNTISLRVIGYQFSYDGVMTDELETMVGIELVNSPGVTVEGNRISTETYTGRNFAAGIALNATMLSGDLRILNNTLEHKASGTQGAVNVVYSTIAQFSVFSHARLENNVIRATIAAVGGGGAGNIGGSSGSTPVVGLAVSYGTLVTAYNCTINGPNYGVLVSDFSDVELDDVNITSVATTGIRVEQGCSIEILGSDISSAGGTRGIEAVASRVTVRDSSMRNPVEVQLEKGAVVELFNTTHYSEMVTALDNESYLNVSWPVQLNAVWQNGAPVAGASLTMRTLQGDLFYSALTGPDGSPGPLVWVREYMVHNMAVARYWPEVTELTLGRASSVDIFMVRSSVNRTLTLIDSIPPELVLNEPAAGARLNNGSVSFWGEASDAETGLRDGQVEIRIDQSEWMSIDMVESFWSYYRALPDGVHACVVRATDGMGNSRRLSFQLTIDTSPPELAVTAPHDGSWTGQRTITVTGVSEVDALVSVNGIPADRLDRYFSARLSLEEGENTVTVVAVDTFGNSRSVETRIILATIAPDLVVASPANNSFTGENYVTVKGTSGSASAVLVNGLAAELSGNGFETVVELAEGQNSLRVDAIDPAGNVRSLTILVTRDARRPDLTVETPRDKDWTNRPSVLVSGTVERGCTVTVNGIVFEVAGNSYSGFLSLTGNANTIEVEARDAAGNTRSQTRTVYWDTQPPSLDILSPAAGRAVASRTVTVSGAVDLVSSLTVNGQPVPVSDFVFSTRLTFVSDGTYIIEVVARDRAGNTATASRTVVIDTTPPDLVFDLPQGSKVKTASLTITGRTEPLAAVSAGKQGTVRADAGGNFTIVVPVEDGKNWIVLSATDAAGNSASRTLNVEKPAAAATEVNAAAGAIGLLLEAGLGVVVAALVVAVAWRLARRPAPPGGEDASNVPAGKPTEKVDGKPTEKPAGKPTEKPAGKDAGNRGSKGKTKTDGGGPADKKPEKDGGEAK